MDGSELASGSQRLAPISRGGFLWKRVVVVQVDPDPANNPLAEAAAVLPPPLVELIQGTGLRLVSAFPVGMLTSPLIPRLTFRLHFQNGVVLKGRQLTSPRHAAYFDRLVVNLGQDAFSRVIASQREALLEEWVAGESVCDVADNPALIRRCGQWLGRLHTCVATSPPRPTTSSTDQIRLAEDIEQLQSSSAGSLLDVTALHSQLLREMPRKVQRGVIHKDFCAENLIIRANGAICCIDNLTITRGPYDLDLARTWYRWPLSPADWQTFLDGYAEFRSPAQFQQNFSYWSTRVVLASVAFRLKYQMVDSEPAIKLLRSLLHADIHS
jgi:Phosphotransferase enzyme family